MDIEIKNLEHVGFDDIFHAFERAFCDYAISFEKEEVRSMLKRRGFNPGLSFAAYDKGEIVAFTLNGTGMYGNISTAYDTGTGTIKEYRGKGLAQEIFTHSIPYLKQAGIEQYVLEVLQDNVKAISVYRKLGFSVTREFDCFCQETAMVSKFEACDKMLHIEVSEIAFERVAEASDFCDFCPSWQNSVESLGRAGRDVVCLGAIADGVLVGYCVFDPLTGDLSQLAVAHGYRRKKVASRLLHDVVSQIVSKGIKALNIPPDCTSLEGFLRRNNLKITGKQFEMIRQL